MPRLTPPSGAGLAGLLAVALIVSSASFRVRDTGDMSVDWQVALQILVWAVAFLIGLARLPRTYGLLTRSAGLWLSIFLALGLLSVAYSPVPAFSLASWLAFTSFFLLAAAAIEVLGRERLLHVVANTFTLFLLVSWLAFVLVPDIGTTVHLTAGGPQTRISGIAVHANELGRIAALTVGVLIALRVIKDRVSPAWVPQMALALTTLVATQSRTALLGFAGATLVFLVRYQRRSLVGPVLAVFAIAGMGMIITPVVDWAGLASGFSRTGDIEELTTLTGRLVLWPAVVGLIADAPIWGHGFAASREVLAQQLGGGTGWVPTHPHNLLFQALLYTGLAGATFFVCTLARQVRDAVRRPSVFPDYVVIFVLITGVAETTVLSERPGAMTLLWFLSVLWRNPSSGPVERRLE